MEKGIPCKWKQKERWVSITHIRQNRLWNKNYNKRQEDNYIIIKGSIQEDITFVNV